MPFLAQDAVFRRLSEIAEVAALSKEERREYDESLRHYRDTIAVMHGQFLEGESKGLAIGLAKGRAEGRAEGTIAIARNLKVMNLPIEDIMKATNLSAEEIERL